MIIGTTMLMLGRLSVKIGLKNDVSTYVKNQMSIPNIIANLIFIVKP